MDKRPKLFNEIFNSLGLYFYLLLWIFLNIAKRISLINQLIMLKNIYSDLISDFSIIYFEGRCAHIL